MSSPLRIGVVGCGRVSRHHIRHVLRLWNAAIVGVSDADDAAATDAARAALGAPAFDSLAAMISSAAPDVVHITTPPDSHFALALEAILRGVHVLVEKPLALESGQCRRLYDEAESRRLVLCPNFIQLFHPATLEAEALVASGAIGRVLDVSAQLSVDLGGPDIREARGRHWSFDLPGGILRNYITHAAYLALRWTGVPRALRVLTRADGVLPRGLTDHVDVLVDGEAAAGRISLFCSPGPAEYRLRILGSKGGLDVDFSSGTLIHRTNPGLPGIIDRATWDFRAASQHVSRSLRTSAAVARGKILPYQGLAELLPRLYDSVRRGAPPPVPRWLSEAVARVEEAAASAPEARYVVGTATIPRRGSKPDGDIVAVTGAAGYLGRALVSRLSEAGRRVRCIVRPVSDTAYIEALGVEVCFADIRDIEAMRKALRGARAVVHCAAGLSGSPDFIVSTCVQGTETLAAAAAAEGLSRVIYVSSASVYDFSTTSTRPLSESADLERSPERRGTASLAKRQAEDVALAALAAAGPAWTILRPGLIFGGGRDPAGLLSRRLLGARICIGGPRQRQRLVHVRDVAAAVLKALDSPATRGRVFNVAHPQTVSLSEAMVACVPGRRAFYLSRALLSPAASALRLLARVAPRIPAPDPKRVDYLFADAPLSSESFISATGWAPERPLLEQLAAEAAEARSRAASAQH